MKEGCHTHVLKDLDIYFQKWHALLGRAMYWLIVLNIDFKLCFIKYFSPDWASPFPSQPWLPTLCPHLSHQVYILDVLSKGDVQDLMSVTHAFFLARLIKFFRTLPWTFSACFEDDSETLIDLIKVDRCTLVPLGLLRNFLERHSTSGSGLFIQSRWTLVIMPLAERRSLKQINLHTDVIIEQ